ncbi:hypothetical protein [Paenibacillus medicaginis]|uniref:RNA dependent RNA polymerase n=1 Tax=Paenibacillus medicaginis TaxID=1470560 RepID=A0ABV5BVQ6_9BACL
MSNNQFSHVTDLHKPVYIPSIEGNDIYNHIYRDRELDLKYIGMIPSSLELNKLIDLGLRTTRKKTSDKLLSTDVINVKFRQKVDSGNQIIKKLEVKIEKLDNKPEYKEKLIKFIEQIKTELHEDKWKGISQIELRKQLYTNGFVLNGVKYVVYKRSSAKSRVGQCLFIKEKLYKPMIKWSRMGLDFGNKTKDKEIDYPSLLAYESLVGSSIESIIHINPNNILIVDDVKSVFSQKCNVVRTGENGFLDSFEEMAEIENSLFDGESLLEASYFPPGKSMILLRNHMFKSAAFNCNIQQFLKDNCPDDIEYENWQIPSMFNNDKVFAKDIHLITTPSSLKALKFSKLQGTEKDMWGYWKDVVIKDGCLFGVCKSEKMSKQGVDDRGRVLQQTSYQMLNSLPMTKDDINVLTKFEKEYINKLKNNDDFFIEYIKDNKNDMNSNEMFADIYERNPDIVNTKIFRKFRKNTINGYVTHIKNGKVRMHGDYCVMLGNPIEFLYHTIGKLNVANPEPVVLTYNEVYTTMFEEKELTGFRNPHTSPNNVLLVRNRHNAIINKYFNLTDNIVCVNAIQFPLQDILSGSDYDSDTVLLIDNDHLLSITKRVFGEYNVCINKVSSSKREYRVCNEDMAIIDNELSNSQKYIGRTVNTGQLCMSRYWDLLNNGKKEDEVFELIKKIDVVTVLSGICIDLAKKMFDININKEIEYISKAKELKKEKPLFWKYVSQSAEIITSRYDCPMDFLYEEMSDLNYADKKDDIPLYDLLIQRSLKNVIRRQEYKINNYVETMVEKINNTYGSNLSEEERDRRIDDIIRYYKFFVDKLLINENTMYSLIYKVSKNKKDKIASRLLRTLHMSNKTTFIDAFLAKNDTLLK